METGGRETGEIYRDRHTYAVALGGTIEHVLKKEKESNMYCSESRMLVGTLIMLSVENARMAMQGQTVTCTHVRTREAAYFSPLTGPRSC